MTNYFATRRGIEVFASPPPLPLCEVRPRLSKPRPSLNHFALVSVHGDEEREVAVVERGPAGRVPREARAADDALLRRRAHQAGRGECDIASPHEICAIVGVGLPLFVVCAKFCA